MIRRVLVGAVLRANVLPAIGLLVACLAAGAASASPSIPGLREPSGDHGFEVGMTLDEVRELATQSPWGFGSNRRFTTQFQLKSDVDCLLWLSFLCDRDGEMRLVAWSPVRKVQAAR